MKKNVFNWLKQGAFTALLFVAVNAKAQQGSGRTTGPDFAPYQLQGFTLKQILDFVGERHNGYLDYIYAKLSANPGVFNSKELQSFLKIQTTDYFAALGITPQNSPLPGYFDLTSDYFDSVSYSPKAMAIIIELRTLQMNYDVATHFETITALNNLRLRAMELEDYNEAVKTGIPVSIAIFSSSYWYENTGKWQELFIRCGNVSKCDVEYKKLIGADVKGAVGGAYIGTGGGAAGAVAGGLFGGSLASTYNIVKQGIICAGGVVGRVLGWIDSWF
jgi:hypothetical protein